MIENCRVGYIVCAEKAIVSAGECGREVRRRERGEGGGRVVGCTHRLDPAPSITAVAEAVGGQAKEHV
jgi:hypothetical protein